jgi:hypothetical protein
MKNTRQMFFSLLVVLSLLFSSFGSIYVYADDTAPTPEQTEEAVVEQGTTESAPEVQASEEVGVDPIEETGGSDEGVTEEGSEGGETTPEATEQIVEETEATTEEPTVEPTPILSDEELDTLPEILENVPEGTEVIVLDEDGNAESMASEEAAITLIEGDPIWCQDGYAPDPSDTTHCTASHSSFASLIAELSANVNGYFTGSGTIWVAYDYDAAQDNAQISFDGDNSNLVGIATSDLTIQGGWDGIAGSTALQTGTSFSTIDVSLAIQNWTGLITLNNLFINNTTNPVGFGLAVDTNGNVELNNVEVSGTAGAGADGAIIDSTGDVNITASTFSNNGGDGLNIDAYGSTTITDVTAINNGLSGILIDNGTIGQTNTVSISGTTLSDNGAPGLYLTQYADGTISLNAVISNGNSLGAEIYTSQGTGEVNIIGSSFYDNDYTGLHVESAGNISLNNVIAGSLTLGDGLGNNSNGAYLVTDGNISVTGSTFNENVLISSPSDPGLYAKAGGSINLNSVQANGNQYGAGAVLISTGTGLIEVENSSQFNNNGTFGIEAKNYDGNIYLDGVTASDNAVKGAYLFGYDTSDIRVRMNSIFNGNGSYGIYATVDEGNITVDNVSIDGENVTDTGAKLVNNGGGTVDVSDSTFINMQGTGLSVIANGIVNLDNNDFTTNGANGAEIFSTYSVKECYCAGDVNTSVIVSVTGGTFTENGQYGLYVKPGDEGTVDILTTPPTFVDNVAGEYLINTDPIPECDDCNCVKPEKPEGKPYNIVEVPFSGSGNVPQECSIFAGTIFQMADGTFVKVGCPFEGFSNLQGVNESDLPGLLGAGSDFDLGILLGLLSEDGSFILNSDGTITITFVIPETSRGRSHRMLYWDTSLNDGAGGWFQMPPFETGTSFRLHPDDPDDPRLIVSGVIVNGNTMTVTINFAGYFVVVSE